MTPYVLFVHGAHHGAWCWDEVRARLAPTALRTAAVDLPLTSFEDDTRAVRTAVREGTLYGPVLLVAHSYGGLPVSAGGHEADRLVYIAARMPQPGESPAESTPRWNDPAFRAAVHESPDGTVTLLPAAREALYSGTPAPYADRAAARWRPMRSRVPRKPLDAPAWLSVPSAYVICAEDRTVRPEAQRECATHACTHLELPCDHAPFYSAPTELAHFLEEQAALTNRPEG
ncbi:alpha/beta fold hydrolase [Streptomyces niveiscabiei]|uniref:alpha/beta fold hydrolase n=1 Tax=Streptomyces niveiscabiei TaxID=164115 RepID=UPI0029A65F15|nr:alpha/beta fold hydrolase [Streptomyces niveiscabiei]MDX3384639.1 alpha/beta fold hydrolase [Streptomyces niveiscabiei]